MAIALPIFLNQSNKARTASNSDSQIDRLTGMSGAYVGVETSGATNLPLRHYSEAYVGVASGATNLPLRHYAEQVHRLSMDCCPMN